MNRHNYKISLLLLLSLYCLSSSNLSAQQNSTSKPQLLDAVAIDSISTDSYKKQQPSSALKWALIPGGGQVYNNAWWKVPIVYGGLLGAIGYAENSRINYQRASNALRAKCYGVDDPENCSPSTHEFTGTSLDNINALRNLRDTYDKRQQSAYIFVFVAYLLQGIEAYTDAHLKDFDVDDDLSLIKLGPIPQNNTWISYGLSVQLDRQRSIRKQRIRLNRLSK